MRRPRQPCAVLSRRTGEAHEHGRGPVCGHARTCCCARCRTPCATRHSEQLLTFTTQVTPSHDRRTTSRGSRLVLQQQLSQPPRCPQWHQRKGWDHYRQQCHPSRAAEDSQCGRWITALSIHIDPSMRWQCEQHSRPGDAPGRTEVRLGACRDAMCASICTSTWSSSWAETGLRAAWLADTAHRGGVHRGHRAAPHCVEARDQVALGAQDTDRTLSKDQLSQGCVSGDS